MININKNPSAGMQERWNKCRKVVPDGEKECVWAEAGVVPYKLCNSHFDCTNCSFDIVMRGGNELIPRRISSKGGELCTHRFYSQCHTWAQVEEKGYVRIGIDDFGQNILGPIEEICLPLRDEKIGKKSIRIKARGSIIPLIPYEEGWMVLIRPTRLVKNLNTLFYGTATIQWFDVEMHRLAALISTELNHGADDLGMTLPDGGLPDFDILNELPPGITKKVLEQCFHNCPTNDKCKD
jgi:glycine cleavage system H lipoate-binding protein